MQSIIYSPKSREYNRIFSFQSIDITIT